MSSDQEFRAQLQAAVQQKFGYVNTQVLGTLKENFRSLHSNFRALMQLCQKKGILKEDPYKKERQISEVTPPADSPFAESYKEDELAIRLSEYDSQFEFLNHYTSFNLEHLGLRELKALLGMIRFVRWTEFSTNSTRPTTRVFAEILDKIRKGSDSFSAGAVNSSLNQCTKIAKEITEQLKQITYLKREEYKLDVREKILSRWDLGTAMPTDMFMKEIKRAFPGAGMTQPFFPELIEEIYAEDFGESMEEGRKQALKNLEVPQRTQNQGPAATLLKENLIEGLRSLGTASRHIDIAVGKLKENSLLLESRPKGLMERFREWIVQLSSGRQTEIIYEIEFVDMITSAHTSKEINFTSFCASVEKKSRVLQGFLNKQSPAFQKVRAADEDQLFALLEKNISDLSEIVKHFDAFDAFFKTEVGRLNRDQVRGIKNDTLAIQNSLAAASQKKHEFVARREEIDQLKKLGIQTSQ